MGFSVVGLPHYTIWHLYEPSVDDLRHMEEMEVERQYREAEEKEQAERARRAAQLFRDVKTEKEIDNAFVKDDMETEQQARKVSDFAKHDSVQGAEEGPAVPVVKPAVEPAVEPAVKPADAPVIA